MSQHIFIIASTVASLIIVVAVVAALSRFMRDEDEWRAGDRHFGGSPRQALHATGSWLARAPRRLGASLRASGAWLWRAPRWAASAVTHGCKVLAAALAALITSVVRLPLRFARRIGGITRKRRTSPPSAVTPPPPVANQRSPQAVMPEAAQVAASTVASVASTQSPAPRERPFVRRRRIRRFAAVLTCAAVGAVLAAGVWQYHELTDQLHRSNQQVSGAVRHELTPSGSVVSDPQVTLISGTAPSGGRTAVSVVLLSTHPGDHRISTLYIPRSSGVVNGTQVMTVDSAYEQGGLPLVTRALGQTLGIPINHVVALDLRQIVSMVDALGGITMRNPATVTIPPQDNSPGGVFPAGRLQLDGQRAATFMHSGPLDDAADDRAQALRQGLVLKALVNRIVALPLSHAPGAARAILQGSASDLTESDILGLIWVRFHASQLTECLIPGGGGELSTAPGSPANGFIASAPSPDCRPRRLAASPIPLPASVTGLAIWVIGVPAAIVVLALGLAAMLWYRRRRRRSAELGGVIDSPMPERQPIPPRIQPHADVDVTPAGEPDGPIDLNEMSRLQLFSLALDRGMRRADLINLSQGEIRELLAKADGVQERS